MDLPADLGGQTPLSGLGRRRGPQDQHPGPGTAGRGVGDREPEQGRKTGHGTPVPREAGDVLPIIKEEGPRTKGTPSPLDPRTTLGSATKATRKELRSPPR